LGSEKAPLHQVVVSPPQKISPSNIAVLCATNLGHSTRWAAAEAGVLHPIITGQLAKRHALGANVGNHHKNTVCSPSGTKGPGWIDK
jgi:hypothetical protein